MGVVSGGQKGRRRVGGDEKLNKKLVPDLLAGSDMTQRNKVKSHSGARTLKSTGPSLSVFSDSKLLNI